MSIHSRPIRDVPALVHPVDAHLRVREAHVGGGPAGPERSAEWVSPPPPRDTRNPPVVVGSRVATWVRVPWWVKRTGDESLRSTITP